MKILFVCIGNSCRSPMAESVMKSIAARHNLTDWQIDSAALREWNVGRLPEPRAITILAENGLTSDHVTRLITTDDFRQFDYVFGMDESNVADLLHLAPVGCRARIELLGNYRGRELDRIIIDPYFEIRLGLGNFTVSNRSYEKPLPVALPVAVGRKPAERKNRALVARTLCCASARQRHGFRS
uniref:Phosphotyrosine protein phosphatase I domain-containing protein n=1 Tax=Anopheles farauti TaxID=69004 RepID=A0A182Q6B4_9DIPT